jgi:hypothetical protein
MKQCSPPNKKSPAINRLWLISISHTQMDDLGVLRSTWTRKLANLVLACS